MPGNTRLEAAALAKRELRPGERPSVRRLMKIAGVKRMTAARMLHDPAFLAALDQQGEGKEEIAVRVGDTLFVLK
jgi:hypothetical protein